MLKKSNKVKANASSENPREWPIKNKLAPFLNSVFKDPKEYELELIDGEYRVTPKGLLSTGSLLTAIVIAAHRYGIYCDILSWEGRPRIYLYSDPNHATLDSLFFSARIEE
jgi:hypothetical protein